MKRYLERIQQVSMEDYIIIKTPRRLVHASRIAGIDPFKDPSRKTAGPVLSTTVYYSLLNLMTGFAVLQVMNKILPDIKTLQQK